MVNDPTQNNNNKAEETIKNLAIAPSKVSTSIGKLDYLCPMIGQRYQ